MRIGEIAGYLGEIAGYLAAVLVFLTFYMKTMIPLRIIGICSNCMFIIYGSLDGLYPVLVLHLILLPLNGLRLREMLRLTQQVRRAAQGDLNMDWLKPFTSTHWARSGDVLFRKGKTAILSKSAIWILLYPAYHPTAVRQYCAGRTGTGRMQGR